MMNIFRRNHHGNKGFILVTTLSVSTVLLIIVISYISRIATEYRLVSKMSSSTIAINVAEAGIERAIWEICYNSSTFSGWTHAGTVSTDQTWTINNVQFKDPSGKSIGYYDGSVFLPHLSKTKTITVTAYVPNKTKRDGEKTVIVNYYSEGLFPLSNAIAAYGLGATGDPLNNSIKIDSNVGDIDSYDSSIGPYNDPGQAKHNQANIVTNGNIQMSAADAHVNGNAYYGGKFAGNSKAVTGIVDKLQAPLTINFPDDGLAKAKNGNNDNDKIGVSPVISGYSPYNPANSELIIQKGTTVTLTYDPGSVNHNTYYFTKISMGGDNTTNAIKIAGDGPVTIYVDGGKITTSGIANINTVDPKGQSNPLPGNLVIYSNYNNSDTGVSIGDECNLYGVLYVPNAITEIDEANLYGAIVCKTIHFSGATNLHFDTMLEDATSNTSNDGPRSWQEQ